MSQNHKKLFLIILIIVLAAIYFCVSRQDGLPGNLGGKWQAVFLTDGQVYFGKLENENRSFAVLKNVYYLKVSSGLQQGVDALTARNLNLIKLGGEAHGPESEMFISKDQILFIENLKEGSTVVQAILNNQR
jgi:hypothetical protein